MISNQMIRETIEDIKTLTRVETAVYSLEGMQLATTLEEKIDIWEDAKIFVESGADSQELHGCYYFKIYENGEPEALLIAKGQTPEVYTMGKLAVTQLHRLINAYRDKYDKNTFIQKVLTADMTAVDIYNKARKLKVAVEKRRVVYAIETDCDDISLATVKELAADSNRDFVVKVEDNLIIMVRELDEEETTRDMQHTSDMLVDMLNAEAMAKARVAYGMPVNELKDISESYKEARMALDIGRIFYGERPSIAYSALGIGRLIYNLPKSLCETFLEEVFKGHSLEEIDEETMATVKKFLETNLNVSETARQRFVHRNTLTYRFEKLEKMTGLDIKNFDDAMTFKIGWMVANYLKESKNDDVQY